MNVCAHPGATDANSPPSPMPRPPARHSRLSPTLFVAGTFLLVVIATQFRHRSADGASAPHSDPPRAAQKLTATGLSSGEVDAILTESGRVERERQLAADSDRTRAAAERAGAAAEDARAQLEQRAQRLEQQANARVAVLADQLLLTDEQKDQVFQILVQTSRTFDSSMATSGADGRAMAALPAAAGRSQNSLPRLASARPTPAGGSPGSDPGEAAPRDGGVADVAAVADDPATVADPAELANDLAEALTPEQQAKVAETTAINEILDPVQQEEYADLLGEIDNYWDALVQEVASDIEAVEAAEAAVADPSGSAGE